MLIATRMSYSREVFDEAMRRMKSRSLFGENDYYDMTDEVVADFIDNGNMREEDDSESFREKLEMLWQQRQQQDEEE